MDPYAQLMLEKAVQRSRALGIKKGSQNTTDDALSVQQQQQPIVTSTIDKAKNLFAQSSSSNTNKLQVVEKTTPLKSPSNNKVLRQFSAMDKENMDVGIEINIMSHKDMEVQVQVEEHEITDGDLTDANEQCEETDKMLPEPAVRIRDSSRNHLQRLGALYSNTDDLSSPIHRTEGKFHAESNLDDKGFDTSPKKINKQQRLGKLAALASTINQWEDDLSHPSLTKSSVPPPKPDLPSRNIMSKKPPAPKPPTPRKTPTKETETKKNLQWDQRVINSLEAQGFQRRESSTVKYAYEYNKLATQEAVPENDVTEIELPAKGAAGMKQIAQTYDKQASDRMQQQTSIKQGLVSGRAAVFEKASQQQQQNASQQKQEKDPTELSLKERRQLFERNKGEALVPKAAFGMAPAISKIRQEVTAALKKDEEDRKAVNKPSGESNVRDRVAALAAKVQSNAEQNKTDMQKQRQEEMALLSNRFNKQKEVFAHERKPSIKRTHAPPPPPPPMPPATYTPEALKRRSPGNTIDDDDESKRVKKTDKNTNLRLYPALSDLEQSDPERQHTPTTASAQSSHDEIQQNYGSIEETEDDNEDSNESYMEEEEDDMCNVSLGREIMQVVQKNEYRDHQQQQQQKRQIKEVRYADTNRYYENNMQYAGEDSSLNSSETSTGVDDLLDEAMGDDDFTQDEEADVNVSNRVSQNE